MLVLSRKPGQSIIIDGAIRVTIVAVDGDRVRVGIEAPASVDILRAELVSAVSSENRAAATLGADRTSIESALRALHRGSSR
jgi:carbon storage regulator